VNHASSRARPCDYALRIFDLRGQRVRNLLFGYRSAGQYRETWDGMDDTGHAVASGTLFCLGRL